MHALTMLSCSVEKKQHLCSCGLTRPQLIVSWLCRLGVAAILAQTLFFKFTYASETQVIFGPLGGRPAATVVGIMELLAVILLLIPQTVAYGALLALGTIGGAIVSHLTWLGFVIVDPSAGTLLDADEGCNIMTHRHRKWHWFAWLILAPLAWLSIIWVITQRWSNSP